MELCARAITRRRHFRGRGSLPRKAVWLLSSLYCVDETRLSQVPWTPHGLAIERPLSQSCTKVWIGQSQAVAALAVRVSVRQYSTSDQVSEPRYQTARRGLRQPTCPKGNVEFVEFGRRIR